MRLRQSDLRAAGFTRVRCGRGFRYVDPKGAPVVEVAEYLGNTPAVCRASYINPRIIELYEEGRTIAPALGALGAEHTFGQPATQGTTERAVLDLLTDASAPV